MRPRVLLLVVAALPVLTFASRILLLPTAADSSHIFTLRAVHDELQRRGHESTVRSSRFIPSRRASPPEVTSKQPLLIPILAVTI